MKNIFNFNDFINEWIQDDYFTKHPEFYISKNIENSKKLKQYNKEDDEKESLLYKKLKDVNFNTIEFSSINDLYLNKNICVIQPKILNDFMFIISKLDEIKPVYPSWIGNYAYRVILSFIDYYKKESYNFKDIENDTVNDLMKIGEYYGIYYSYIDDSKKHTMLYITKNEDLYKDEISELLQEDVKIIYNNNKIKGKELFDYDTIEINKIKNKLKVIDYTDVSFESNTGLYDVTYYTPKFNDTKLNDEIEKYKLISKSLFYNEVKSKKEYFGHLKNRFHCNPISEYIRGIGIGYKLYKAFIKYQGYTISDEDTTIDARNVYFKLLHDDDIYHIIDSENNKVMLIWKDNKKLEQILRIVRQYELSNELKFDYDKKIEKYL